MGYAPSYGVLSSGLCVAGRQKVLKEQIKLLHYLGQGLIEAVIAIEQVQFTAMLPCKIEAVERRNYVIAPTMNNKACSGEWRGILIGIAGQIKGRGHQKQSVNGQVLAGHG